jgi:hypothetical protein
MRMLKDAIAEVASRGRKVIDARTRVGKELMRWRGELIADLGGELSTQQLAIVDIAVRGKLLLDSVDAWLLHQPSLVDKRHRSLYPVVAQRQALADGLLRQLTALGLGRVAKRTPSLADYLAKTENSSN